MSLYRPLNVRSFQSKEAETPAEVEEKRWWGMLREADTPSSFGRVHAAQYSPTSPHNLVVAWTGEVVCYNALNTSDPLFRLTSPHGIHSVRYRNDGKLITYTEGDRGRALVCMVDGGRVIREFQAHRGVVRQSAFTADKIQLATWGEDRNIHVSSLATGDVLYSAKGAHTCGIRSGDTHSTEANLILSGSEDNVMKLFDTRASGDAVTTYKVGSPVWATVFGPGDVVIGGSMGTVNVFDMRNASACLHTAAVHAKAVVGLSFARDHTRLVTASLDRTFRVLDVTQGYRAVYTPAPCSSAVNCVAVSPDGQEMVVGRDDGVLSRRIAGAGDEEEDNGEPRKQHWARVVPNGEGRRTRMTSHDYALRNFRNRDALVNALSKYTSKHEQQQDPSNSAEEDLVYSVLQELVRRNALRMALAGWDEAGVYDLLRYLVPCMKHRSRTTLVVTVLEAILEIYCEAIIRSQRLMPVVQALRDDVAMHVRNVYEMETISASIDVLVE